MATEGKASVHPGNGTVHNIAKFLLFPAIAPLSILALYFTPKETFGCTARGLLAVAVALLSLFCALVTAWKYKQVKAQGTAGAVWPLAATLLLILPVVLLLGPLG